MGFVLRKNKDSFFLGRAELPREPALCMLAVIYKNPKRCASFLVFLRGKFGELLLGKLSLNVDNNAGGLLRGPGHRSLRLQLAILQKTPCDCQAV
jgi:hypothetical protein